jgi:hypothetical protein
MSRQSIGVANEAPTIADRVVVIADGTTKLDPATHANRLLLLTDADASYIINLPIPTGSGDRYEFLLGIAMTSGSIVINATHGATSSVIVGIVTQHGSANVVTRFASTANDIMTLDRTTKGAKVAGDHIVMYDTAPGVWRITEALLSVSGTAATPFSG